jgi:acetolactate synthase-1/2/3 large subunit
VAESAARRAEVARESELAGDRITRAQISACLAAIVGPEAVIFNENPLSSEHLARENPGTYYTCQSVAGGLGWALGAAIGMKMAAPEKLVVTAVGDGTYLFSSPLAVYWTASKYRVPTLTIVVDNGGYEAVRTGVLGMYPDGLAARDAGRLFSDLTPLPPFADIVTAQGGFGAKVERVDDLPDTLKQAHDAVLNQHRQALVHVTV